MTKKEIINKVFNSVWFVILIGGLLLAKTFLFYNNTIAINEPIEIETIVGTVCFIFVIVCFLSILPNRMRIILCILVDFLFFRYDSFHWLGTWKNHKVGEQTKGYKEASDW